MASGAVQQGRSMARKVFMIMAAAALLSSGFVAGLLLRGDFLFPYRPVTLVTPWQIDLGPMQLEFARKKLIY
jgi:hypothetical protein